MLTSFQQEYLYPIARRLFPVHASQFDGHHSFMVRYQAGEDLGLDMHTDDSDVTFNICLGLAGFIGATLQFCGMFGSPNHRQWSHTYTHEMGRAILHLGSRRHGAEDIISGTRINLIVWNYNSVYRRSAVGQHRSTTTNMHYQREAGPPDPVCVSWTHDRDYVKYKPYPPESIRAKHRIHPWCPPRGKEYHGYYDNHESNNDEEKKIFGPDEL